MSSRSHFTPDRKAHANKLDSAFTRLYQQHWGNSVATYDFQDGTDYPLKDSDKSLAQIHDLMGADRLILKETGMGSVPIFIEEKTRTFKREKLDKGWYNKPFDEDLALTIEYHDKRNQPKHRKQLKSVDTPAFVPGVLAYIVHEKETDEAIRGYLIDYHDLLTRKDELQYDEQRNDRDGNTTHYIPQIELVENDMVLYAWTNEEWQQ